jgi:hypothetical protein
MPDSSTNTNLGIRLAGELKHPVCVAFPMLAIAGRLTGALALWHHSEAEHRKAAETVDPNGQKVWSEDEPTQPVCVGLAVEAGKRLQEVNDRSAEAKKNLVLARARFDGIQQKFGIRNAWR